MLLLPLQVYLGTDGAVADPTSMLSRLAQVPLAAEFFDGGQHDCQEVLRTLLNALHDDLVSTPMPPPSFLRGTGTTACKAVLLVRQSLRGSSGVLGMLNRRQPCACL